MKTQISTLEQAWQAIDEGKTVYCGNTAYKLTVEPVNHEWLQRLGFAPNYSTRGDHSLRVTCIANWFGCTLHPNEVNQLFTLAENN